MTEADFVWAEPDLIDTNIGSTLTRLENPLAKIWWYKKPGYIEETVTYVKQVCQFTDSDSYVLPTTSGELRTLFDTKTITPVWLRFHRTMTNVLRDNYTPRSYRYTSTYRPLDDDSEETWFYDLTKLYQFYINPPTYFRAPFSIGSEHNRKTENLKVCIHPGNYRLLATLFLPENIPCCMLARTDDYNLLNNLTILNNQKNTVLKIDHNDLANMLNLQDLHNANVRWSSITGIQIVEQHSILPEYNKEFNIEWTGSQFVVNNLTVATLKNDFFIPGG